MTPERWGRIKEVFQAAIERAESERGAFLERTCGSDLELREAVERLLREHDETTGLRSPVAAWDPSGRRISHYEIAEKLGGGGMGVVYKARDLKLDRFVALKFLPPAISTDEEYKGRFVREAKAASALDHPNICTIHEIDETEDGRLFIAMAYYKGESLKRKIQRGPLPLTEALELAAQVAQGLVQAHQQGITHRDIKPANVMVTEEGVAKIVDFGLAQLGDATRLTKTGTTLGTPAYMSPEQVRSEPVDRRTDIWSFGVVLYEMLCGRLPFRDGPQASVTYSIVHEDHEPVTALRAGLPIELEWIVGKLLSKKPSERYQHAHEVLVDLRKVQRQVAAVAEQPKQAIRKDHDSPSSPLVAVAGTGTMTSVPRPRRRIATWLPAAGVAVVILGALGGAWLWTREATAPPPPSQGPLVRLTSDTGLATDPALSADGRLVAYASDRATSESEGNLDIWVQQVAGGESLRLTRGAADEREPFFSPDASTIVYRSEQDGGGIYMVSTLGGEPRRIAREGRGARYSPSSDLIAYWTGGWHTGGVVQGKTYIVPAGGGQARQLQPDFHSVTSPLWSPDGQRILFLGARDAGGLDMLAQEMDWWITPLDGGRDAAVRTGAYEVLREQEFRFGGASAEWIAGSAWLGGRPGESRILFSARSGDARNTWQIIIDERTWQVSRAAGRLTLSVGSERTPTAALLSGGVVRLVFASLRVNFDIWSLPLDPDRAVIQGPPRRLTEGEDDDMAPSLSLDGKKLAYVTVGRGSVWLKDLSSGKEEFLANGLNPAISPDGSKVAYLTGPPQRTFVIPASGGVPELVCEGCGWTSHWSHDGVNLLVNAGFEGSLGLVVFGQQKPISLLQHPGYPLDKGRFSPDGRWVAFHAIPDPTTRRIFVAPFRDPSQSGTAPVEEKEWIPITDGAGMERYAAWSPDGNVLYFLSERDGFRCLRAQRLDGTTKRPVGEAFDVYHFHHARRSLLNAGDPVLVNPTVAVDKVAFGLVETTGNIWMTELSP